MRSRTTISSQYPGNYSKPIMYVWFMLVWIDNHSTLISLVSSLSFWQRGFTNMNKFISRSFTAISTNGVQGSRTLNSQWNRCITELFHCGVLISPTISTLVSKEYFHRILAESFRRKEFHTWLPKNESCHFNKWRHCIIQYKTIQDKDLMP